MRRRPDGPRGFPGAGGVRRGGRRLTRVVARTALVAAVVLACGSGEEGASAPAVAPSQAGSRRGVFQREIPPGLPGDPQQGRFYYSVYCASCHGDEGGGDGAASAGLDPKPARHNDGRIMNALPDDYLFRVIQGGGAAVGKSPVMAAWGETLRDDQIWDLVAFIRTLARPPYRPSASAGSSAR